MKKILKQEWLRTFCGAKGPQVTLDELFLGALSMVAVTMLSTPMVILFVAMFKHGPK